MIDGSIIFYGFLIIFFAGLARGMIGFGIALIAVPFLVLLLPLKTVIPVILILAIFANFPIIIEARKFLDIKRILPLIISAIIGVPLGTYMLIILPSSILKIIIGFTVVIFAFIMLLGLNKKIENEKLAFIPVGFVAGLLQGAIAMGGPAVVLFFSNQGMMKQSFRINIVVYFFVLQIFTFFVYIANGLITQEVLRLSSLFFFAMILGTLAGVLAARKIRELLFRKIVLSIVTASGILTIISGFRILS